MKLRTLALLCLGLFGCTGLIATEPTPASAPTVLVSVHGAWAGGWQMKKVAPILEAQGWKVYRPSLPGLGEHYPRATPDIGLNDHIDDIVNLILFEDLHDIILLGHSYGGMVITGVADRIPGRIRRLVYLDAFLPTDGESLMSLRPRQGDMDLEKMTKDGFIIPTWVQPDRPLPRDVPHPLKTFTDAISLKNPAAAQVPATYILTVDPGKSPETDTFYASSERARARGWPVIIMEADHVPNWRKPAETAALLLGLK
ncbi:Pyrethroid hydrolase [Lacunisphaera limnophila]|uniref:Pyrethroid hydrolase n=1 Tax=Lacunisphaera limnophila TaxID=1838286 RepID=A0A1D8AWX7_9BACT|nr:alpha/beta hydrolase [Lacunisphaera limnophila]AOS45405.1 Pyrethroid hydrolase [Lacunisphaera limnophila]